MSLYEKEEQNFDFLYERLKKAFTRILENNQNRYNKVKDNYILKNPNVLIIDKIYNYNDLIKRLKVNINKILEDKKNTYINSLTKLEVLNPITTLKRGYSVTKVNDKIINSIHNLHEKDDITVTLSDGIIKGKITKIEGKVK